MHRSRIEQLLQLLAEGKATTAETDELYGYYLSQEHSKLIEALIDDCWDHYSFERFLTGKASEILYQNIRDNMPRRRRIRMGWTGWMAAAAVIAAVVLGWLLQADYHEKQDALPPVVADVRPPVSSRAVLFSEKGGKQLLNTDGIVSAQSGKSHPGSAAYNTIFNPRGSRPIEILLSDSTRLWLNAESSVKYPLRFAADERRVQVSGEAYFEVAHEADRPFIAENGKTEVKVLGTHFNINTFDHRTRVTLLQGLVQVTNQKDSGLIMPGQSALVTDAVAIAQSDTASAVAWKSHLFSFKETPLNEVLQEIGRWYDVNIVYEGNIPKITLSGSIDRNTNASKVLEMLQLTSGLKFEIRDTRIIVKQN